MGPLVTGNFHGPIRNFNGKNIKRGAASRIVQCLLPDRPDHPAPRSTRAVYRKIASKNASLYPGALMGVTRTPEL